jgi:putative AlgH/UPF0301 family transcriptional regulator
MALHTDESLADIEILQGVYYSVKTKLLEKLFRGPRTPIKVFGSHVGWGPGQLEHFLAEGPWRVVPATATRVFHSGPGLWEEMTAESQQPPA